MINVGTSNTMEEALMEIDDCYQEQIMPEADTLPFARRSVF
jgi:hypothetical protein